MLGGAAVIGCTAVGAGQLGWPSSAHRHLAPDLRAAAGAAAEHAADPGRGGADADAAAGRAALDRPARSSGPARPGRRTSPAPSASPARHGAAQHRPQPRPRRLTAQPVYRNPLRAVSGLIPERVDMGVDFGGSGPVYALGDAVITNATGESAGWPGGGWITYRLTDGPAAGLVVYLAEDVKPSVQTGQQVTASTVIASMFAGGDGIETGWAQQSSASAESQLPEAGGISGGGPFPTMVGLNFEELLQALGVVAAPNRDDAGNGTVPPRYPASWTGATRPR
jgi:murein DD-endopeptidase MepM/ murein hydrolase activator NlpD